MEVAALEAGGAYIVLDWSCLVLLLRLPLLCQDRLRAGRALPRHAQDGRLTRGARAGYAEQLGGVSAGDVLIAVDGVSVLDTTTIRELQAAVRAAGRSDIYIFIHLFFYRKTVAFSGPLFEH